MKMSENNSKERKKLSLSGGKLTLKSNLNPNKIPSSVTTSSRSGRNTVQVEVKRSKRNFENKSISEKQNNIYDDNTLFNDNSLKAIDLFIDLKKKHLKIIRLNSQLFIEKKSDNRLDSKKFLNE